MVTATADIGSDRDIIRPRRFVVQPILIAPVADEIAERVVNVGAALSGLRDEEVAVILAQQHGRLDRRLPPTSRHEAQRQEPRPHLDAVGLSIALPSECLRLLRPIRPSPHGQPSLGFRAAAVVGMPGALVPPPDCAAVLVEDGFPVLVPDDELG